MANPITNKLRPSFLLFMVGCIALGCVLGTWQLQRLEWKEGILAQIEARINMPPVDIPIDIPVPSEWEYRPVTASGVYNHDLEVLVFSQGPRGRPGYHVYTPLLRSDGTSVIVNRGWVPQELSDPKLRPDGQVFGPQTLTGLARSTRIPGAFTPDNDPANGIFYYADIHALAETMRLINVAPIFLERDNTPMLGGYPEGGVTRLELPNNHFQYALTWFGLALTFALATLLLLWRSRRSES